LDLQSDRLEVVENLTSQIDTLEEIYLAHNGITTEGASHPTGLAQQFKGPFRRFGFAIASRAPTVLHILTLDELWLSGNKIAMTIFKPCQLVTALDTIYLNCYAGR
jgi:protein phosphatase 1 regulatory subunit 7